MHMKKPILVVGSIAIDNTVYTKHLPTAGTTTLADSYISNIGGKGANQACSALFLGGNVNYIGAVGKDKNGQAVKEYLSELGLKYHIKDSNKPTGVAFITLETTSGENRILIVPGANEDLQKEDIDKYNDLFIENGIFLTQFENSISTVEYIIKKAHDHNMLVVVNPAPYKKINEIYYKYIDIIVPNEHEIEQLTGISNIEEASTLLLDKGAKNVIVTLGGKGSFFINKEKSFYVASHKVNAVDTTAAGDSYLGALVTKLSEGKGIKEAMEFASLASSITVTRKGAIQSLPKLEELN